MTTEEQELGLQGVALVGIVAHRMIKDLQEEKEDLREEKDEVIERLERTVDLLTARVEELDGSLRREAA